MSRIIIWRKSKSLSIIIIGGLFFRYIWRDLPFAALFGFFTGGFSWKWHCGGQLNFQISSCSNVKLFLRCFRSDQTFSEIFKFSFCFCDLTKKNLIQPLWSINHFWLVSSTWYSNPFYKKMKWTHGFVHLAMRSTPLTYLSPNTCTSA